MNKSLVYSVGLLFCLLLACDAYPAPKKQFLPYRPGYIPVYIRNGDTPLEEINLELAEAFHAIPSGRSAGRLNDLKSPRSQNVQPDQGGYIVVKVETPTVSELNARKEKSKTSKDESKVEIILDDTDVKNKDEAIKPKPLSDKKKPVNQKEPTNSKFIQKVPKE